MSRLDDLRGIDLSIARITRVSAGRGAARERAERSGVTLSRPAIAILSALRSSGPVRLSLLSRLTELEAPLISREVRELCEIGYVRRSSDPTDGRAFIVELTPVGIEAWSAHRAAADQIVAETFATWSEADLSELRTLLDRVADDLSRSADHSERITRAS